MPYVEDTVRSVLGQSYANLEYLVVDAGSTDGTVERLHDLLERDERAMLISRPGMGMYDAIFFGFDRAKGDMLAWLNADDLYPTWALDRVAKHLAERPNHRWVSGLPSAWDAEGALTDVRPQGWHPQRLIRDGWFHRDLLGFIQQECIFFSKTLYDQLTPQDRRAVLSKNLAGDYALWRRFALYEKLETIPSVIGGFRRHGDNRSVVHMDEYMGEVRSDGATFLPGPLTPLARHLYWLYAANGARRAVAR